MKNKILLLGILILSFSIALGSAQAACVLSDSCYDEIFETMLESTYTDGTTLCYDDDLCTSESTGYYFDCSEDILNAGGCEDTCETSPAYQDGTTSTCYTTLSCQTGQDCEEAPACEASEDCNPFCGGEGYSNDFGETCFSDGTCETSCVAETCSDLTKNQDETDVDCGGLTCNPCADGDDCSVNSDCEDGLCEGTNSICVSCIFDAECGANYCDENGQCVTDNRPQTGSEEWTFSLPEEISLWQDQDLVGTQYELYDSIIGTTTGAATDAKNYAIIHTDNTVGGNLLDISSATFTSTIINSNYRVFIDVTLLSGMSKTVLIPYNPGSTYFCCPDANSIGQVAPGCSNSFEPTKDANGDYRVFTSENGKEHLMCEGMTNSGAGSQGNANLTTFDEFDGSESPASTDLDFFGYYYNGSNIADTITPGENGACWIEFSTAWGTLNSMGFNGTHYNYTKVGGFAASGFSNITCNDSSLTFSEVPDVQDAFSITGGAAVPEFSDLGWILAAVLGAGGFILVRKKKGF